MVNLVGLIFSPSYTFSLRGLRHVARNKTRPHDEFHDVTTWTILLGIFILSRFRSRLNLKTKKQTPFVGLSLMPQDETCQESRA